MKKLLIFSLFMIMCSPVFALRVGKVDSDLENYMQVVYDSGELAAAVTDLTVSGLSGDDDETYEIIVRTVSGANDLNYGIRINGDAGTDYGRQVMFAEDATSGAYRDSGSTSMPMNYDENPDLGTISLHHAILNVSENLSKTMILSTALSCSGTNVTVVETIGDVYNNTDEVTSLNFHSYDANGFGIGSRFIILRKVPDNDTGMRVGDLEIQGRVLGQWELVSDNDITTAVTDLTISGLAGDSDVLYRLSADLTSEGASGSDYFICPNGDQSVGNFGRQYLVGVDTAVGTGRYNDDGGMRLNNAGNDPHLAFSSESIFYAKSGYERTAISKSCVGINATTIEEVGLHGLVWDNTSDEITSIDLHAQAGNAIGVGSKITLWKLNLSEGDE